MPIKILHVIAGMGSGGAETMIMNWYRNIDRDAIQFDFLLRSMENIYVDEIAKLGGKVYYTSKYPRHYFKNKKETVQFFKQHASEYAAIHVHCNALLYVNILSIAKKYGIKTRIIHSHSIKTKNKVFEIIHKLNRKRIHKMANYFFACSQEAGQWAFHKGIEYQVITNGINVQRFKYNAEARKEWRTKLGIKGKFVLGHVGRFLDVKNHMFLLDVFEEISKKREDARLILVGTGPLENKIKEETQRRGFGAKVQFLGVCKDIENIYSAIDIFVFPSKYEGLGIVLIEAQTSGLLCVASDRIPKECKILDSLQFLPITDSNMWSNYILKTVAIDDRLKCCHDIIKAGFDIKESVKKIQEIYCALCNNTRRSI